MEELTRWREEVAAKRGRVCARWSAPHAGTNTMAIRESATTDVRRLPPAIELETHPRNRCWKEGYCTVHRQYSTIDSAERDGSDMWSATGQQPGFISPRAYLPRAAGSEGGKCGCPPCTVHPNDEGCTKDVEHVPPRARTLGSAVFVRTPPDVSEIQPSNEIDEGRLFAQAQATQTCDRATDTGRQRKTHLSH